MADGKGDITTGAILMMLHSEEFHRLLDSTTFYFVNVGKWATRKPIPIISYNQFISGLSSSVWVAVLVTLLVFSACFKLFYAVYYSHFPPGFVGSLINPFDFILLTFGGITEPDALPWFHRGSASKLIILLWSCFSTFMIFFYNCNLRTRLTTLTHEKPIDTMWDIVDRGMPVFCYPGYYNYLMDGV